MVREREAAQWDARQQTAAIRPGRAEEGIHNVKCARTSLGDLKNWRLPGAVEVGLAAERSLDATADGNLLKGAPALSDLSD